jgi:hypothetical protein
MTTNAIYISAGPHDWVQIAKDLELSDNIEPAYWVDHSDNRTKIAREFSDVKFHARRRAIRGLPSADIEWAKRNVAQIDKDVLDQFRKHTYDIFRSMDRLDPKYAFNYDERVRYYHRLLRYWMGVFEQRDISLVVFPGSPLHTYSILIYAICIEKNIDKVILRNTKIPNIWYIRSNIDEGPQLNPNEQTDINKYTLSEAAEEYFSDLVESNYGHSIPTDHSFLDLLSNVKRYPHYLKKLFDESGSYYKKPHKTVEDEEVKWIEYMIHKYRMKIQKKRLRRYYKKLCCTPEFDKEYVFFPLHYQPERTTVPEGDIYSTQHLAISLLQDILPDDYYIYVKEHPMQFNTFKQGEHCRSRYHYDDIHSLKNVSTVNLGSDINELIDNSIAVATITGTTAWEGIFRNTPSLMFGTAWYSGCPGIYNVKTKSEVADAIEEIIDGINIAHSDIKDYMKNMEKNGFQSYSTNARFSNHIPKEEKIKNTSTAISNYISDIR